jgi:DNA-binding NarL/FixJ family response regulator
LRIERLRGEALAALGRNADAEATLGRVAHWAATLGARSALWRTYLVLGRVQAAQRRRAVAANSFGSARLVIAEIAATLAPEEPLRQTFLTAATAALPRARPLSTRSARKAAFGGLTEREREVAALIARAHTNAEIAGALVIGERTVETHVANIRAKLGLESRREVAAWAIERGL